MHMAVAAGSLAHAQAVFYFGNCCLVVLREYLYAFRFGFHFQQCLLKVQVYGQVLRQTEREISRVPLDLNRLSHYGKKLLVQLNDGVRGVLAHDGWLIVKKSDLSLKERALLVYLDDLKKLYAFRRNVHPAVFIFLDYIYNPGGAARG